MRDPSGLKATLSMVPACPRSERRALPVAASQTAISMGTCVLCDSQPSLPAAMRDPSGL
jgi:hypothetical protein